MHVVRRIVSILVTGYACILLAACGSSSNGTDSAPPTAAFTAAGSTGWVSQATAVGPTATTMTVPAYTMTFTSTSTGAGTNTIKGYLWNFGDGTAQVSSSTPTTTHNYVWPGNYAVTLTATDNNGVIATVQAQVNVPANVAAPTTSVQPDTAAPSPAATAVSQEKWTWVDGADTINSFGVYEKAITPDTNNQPSARQGAVSWIDGQGQLWLFGGNGVDSGGTVGSLNDLWRYNPTSKIWTLMNGSNRANAPGAYSPPPYDPTKTSTPNTAIPPLTMGPGYPSSNYMPGARTGAAHWTDSSGNFWLFGGNGYDVSGTFGSLNDMWQFNNVTGEATWISGYSIYNPVVPSVTVVPSPRAYAATWVDKDGKLWLFGGYGYLSNGSSAVLNDLWKFDTSVDCAKPIKSNTDMSNANVTCNGAGNPWTLVRASTTSPNGVYGAQGSPSTSNIPGARLGAQTWVDASGTVWLFGGSGYDGAGGQGALSDLWSFNPTSQAWTWVAGSSTYGGSASYTYPAVTVPGTVSPAPRMGSVGWTDPTGTYLWLFGGFSYSTSGITTAAAGGNELADLWVFSTTTGTWTWMGGPSYPSTTGGNTLTLAYSVPGIFATTVGTSSTFNSPGARMWSTGWQDANGNFWLFGGAGNDVAASFGSLNDLWQMQIATAPK